MTNDEADDCCG